MSWIVKQRENIEVEGGRAVNIIEGCWSGLVLCEASALSGVLEAIWRGFQGMEISLFTFLVRFEIFVTVS